MADRFVSVPMTLSDLERPDVRNQFFQSDFNNAGYISNVIAFAQMHRAVCQRQLRFLLVVIKGDFWALAEVWYGILGFNVPFDTV